MRGLQPARDIISPWAQAETCAYNGNSQRAKAGAGFSLARYRATAGR